EAYGLSESHRTLAIVLNDPASPAHDRGRAAREFRAALDVAGRQGAHWLQLRAAYSFAEHCEPAEAREVMQQALSWFDERAEADDTELVQACRRRYQT
ncbi:MAG TPA: hypothetical protein VNN80_25490, partial [Polyangiaceae bacterium]|nr:hypothetical protein [Polyangiaceae bacterium]